MSNDSMSIRLLNHDDISQLLTMEESIAAIQAALEQPVFNSAFIPQRQVLINQSQQGFSAFMPCFSPANNQLGIKIASFYKNNRAKKLASINGMVILLDSKTGLIKALLDANIITAMRTAAVCGLATQLLAPASAKNLTIIGAGVQARYLVRAMCCVRKIESIKIYNRTKTNGLTFINEIKNYPLTPSNVTLSDSIPEALQQSDIICTATAHQDVKPLFQYTELQPKAVHINAIGGSTFTACEIDPRMLAQATVVVDHKAAAQIEAGEIISALNQNLLTPDNIIELSQLLANTASINSIKKITFFKAVGFALLDMAIAEAAYTKALSTDKGLSIKYF